jgi:protein-disulfide isomerase
MKNPWVIIGVIVVALIGGSVWYSSTVSESYNEGVVIAPKITGNENAPVKLVEYSDFQCPACGQFWPIVEEVLAEYGDQISFEYKHFPLIQIHPMAQPAAYAAEAAGQQGKFYEYAHLLFTNQATWSKATTPATFFVQYAEELGLDMDQFTRHQRAPLIKDHVRSQFNEARELGLLGTPTFYLNGEKMNLSTIDDFKAQIAAAINPNVGFGLNGSAPAVQMIQVGEDGEVQVAPSGDTEMPPTEAPTAPAAPAAPAVQFGI